MAIEKYGSTPNVTYRSALPPGYDKPRKLCSMVPWDLYITHWSMQATLPGRTGENSPGSILIPAGEDRQDFGNNNYLVLKCHTGAEMALDIMGLDLKECLPNNTPRPGRSSSWWEMGVFVPEGEEPTAAEIQAAKDRLIVWCIKQVEHGDMAFQQFKNAAAVPTIAKKAAQHLKVERDWAQGVGIGSQMIECPCCQNRIRPKAKKCQHCGERVAYNKDGVAYWPDDPARGKAS